MAGPKRLSAIWACGLIALLAACSGSPATQPPSTTPPTGSPTSPPAATSTAVSGSTSPQSSSPPDGSPPASGDTEWTWLEDTGEEAPADDPASSGEPDGVAAGDIDDQLPEAVDTPEPMEFCEDGFGVSLCSPTPDTVEPCNLLQPDDWFAWTDEAMPAGALLEDGEACGWQTRLDDMRLAIGVFDSASSARFLDETLAATGTAVDGLGDRAVWLEQWPLPQSSTLVIERGLRDVVIEFSARGPIWPARALDTARHFADIALSRLP